MLGALCATLPSHSYMQCSGVQHLEVRLLRCPHRFIYGVQRCMQHKLVQILRLLLRVRGRGVRGGHACRLRCLFFKARCAHMVPLPDADRLQTRAHLFRSRQIYFIDWLVTGADDHKGEHAARYRSCHHSATSCMQNRRAGRRSRRRSSVR